MESKGSLPFEQEPTIGPCTEPHKSSPDPHMQSLKSFIIYHLCIVFQVVSSLQVFYQNFIWHCTCYMPHPSQLLDLITLCNFM